VSTRRNAQAVGRGLPFDDLSQEGAVGLVRALADARPIHIPPGACRQMAAVQRAQSELRRLRSIAPTADDIARRTRLSVSTVRTPRAAPYVGASLDEPLGDDPTPLGELISDQSSPDATDAVEKREASRHLAQSHEEIGAWLGVGEKRSRQIERQALHWLREMVVPVARGVLARSAAQVSHEHHPARAADRDGNDAQRDGQGRAGRQTLPEHGVGGGPHERADRDRGRERAVADGRCAGRVVQGRRRDAGHEASGQDRREAPPLELLVDAREPGTAAHEPLGEPACCRARECEGRQPSEHRAAESERGSSHGAEGQPAGGGEHRPGEECGREEHPRDERGQRRGDTGPHDQVTKLGGGVGEQDGRRDESKQHEPEGAQEPESHPARVAPPPAVDVSCVVHMHSTYSDGTATVDEIAADAAAAGADLVLLTDHDSLAARRDGWEGRRNGVVVLVGTEVSPKAGHYLAFGVDREIAHPGRSAREIAEAVREAGGVGFAAHPFSRGGHMLSPALARRIVLPHGWPALDDPRGCDGIELWSLTTDAAEGWRTPAEAIRWLRDPGTAIAAGPPTEHLRRWDALSARRRLPALGGLDGHQPGVRVGVRVRSPLSHRSTFDLLHTHLLCERPLTGVPEADWPTVLGALRSGAAWLTCPRVAPATGARLWGERPDGSVVAMGAEAPTGRCLLRVRLPRVADLTVVRDGAPWRRSHAAALDLEIGARGVYRLEARIEGRLWLLSNPVHLR
jgi:hypothetical protein